MKGKREAAARKLSLLAGSDWFSPSREALIFLILCGLWLSARGYFLSGKFLWHDEFLSLLSALGTSGEMAEKLRELPLASASAREWLSFISPGKKASLADFARNLRGFDIHPPLFFLLLRQWASWFGNSPFALSCLSSAIAAATLLFFYLFLRSIFSRGRALFGTALLMGTIPFWGAAGEVRQYGLLLFFAVLLTGLAAKAGRAPGSMRNARLGLGLALVSAGGIYTQYLFAFLAAGVFLWSYLVPAGRDRQARKVLLASGAGFALLCLPLVPLALSQFSGQAGRPLPALSPNELAAETLKVFIHLVISPPRLLSFPSFLVGALVIAGLVRPPFPGFRSLFLTVIFFTMLLPAILVAAGVLHIHHLFRPKYFMTAIPVVFAGLCAGAAGWPRAWMKILAGGMLILLTYLNLGSFISYEQTCLNASRPVPCASYPGLVRFVERNAPSHMLTALDTRRPGDVLSIASASSPERDIIIGDCPGLGPALADYATNHGSSAVLFIHKKPGTGERREDCTEQVAAALREKGFKTLGGPMEIRAWTGMVFGLTPGDSRR